MSQAIHCVKLEWKEHKVSLPMVDAAIKALSPEYCGNQAHSCLELWFTAVPEQSVLDQIQAYWDGIDEQSQEAAQYKGMEAIKQEESLVKASALSKLAALGLTPEEISALSL